MSISAAELRDLLNYDPLSGEFTWRVTRGGGISPGDVAGNIDTAGYRQIRVLGRRYKAHRLAYLYMIGNWPSDQLDHIDGVRTNNRWGNIREASASTNNGNRRRPTTNRSGFKGVSWDKKTQRWRACITINGQWSCLGYFETPEVAHAAYVAKAHELFGEYARAA